MRVFYFSTIVGDLLQPIVIITQRDGTSNSISNGSKIPGRVIEGDGNAKKSRKEWIDEYDMLRMEEWATCSREEWITMYEERTSKFNWSELYYIVRKPLET